MSEIQIGGQRVTRDQALRWATTYLTDTTKAWSYPAYDAYRADRRTEPLDEPDLLAPVLLNVSHLSLNAYYGLCNVLDRLNAALNRIPADADLRHASEDELSALGDLFAVLDDGRPPGVQGTILAKILQRKRPGLVPLYDAQIGACYRNGPHAPIPRARSRPWSTFMVLLAAAMRRDLLAQEPLWLEIARLAPKVPITPLRALDIVAWHAGKVALEERPTRP